ncbi:MAG: hypothetical protein KF773_17910 [Deltaproteobacteria bacterium]|nr:hypothetical protein [Deltaproteobacteria bacterium]MCW5804841.1 hypothetical protein [Deltaproteobacteria bacterium]
MQAPSRPRTVSSQVVKTPRPQAKTVGSLAMIADADLRDLLEANLRALHAVLDEQHRALDGALRAVSQLRADLRALNSPNAPWVAALQETRALLYVALREIIVGHDAGATQAFARG